MDSLAFVALSSSLTAWLLRPLLRNFAWRLGSVHRPDGRRVHPQPMPRLGGMPILAFRLVAVGLFLLSPFVAINIVRTRDTTGRGHIARRLGFELVEDLRAVRPWQEFAAQLIAAAQPTVLAPLAEVLHSGFKAENHLG